MEKIDLKDLAKEIVNQFLEMTKFDVSEVMKKVAGELGIQFREYLEKLDLGILVQEYLERKGG